jgi:hypothetical protein
VSEWVLIEKEKLRLCRILCGKDFVVFGVASQISTHFWLLNLGI